MIGWRRWCSAVLLVALVVACGDNSDRRGAVGQVGDSDLTLAAASATERIEPTIEDAGDVEDVAAATRAFALDLYGEVAGDGGNTVIGPYSAWLALAMASVGADGATYDELADALAFPLGEARLLPAINALDRIISNQGAEDEAALDVANRLWGQEGLEFEEAFLDALVEHFGAPLVVTDFADDPEGSRAQINGWVAEHTDSHIPELFPPESIDQSTRLALVNAMHLDAPWEFAFDPDRTSGGRFTRADGSRVDAEMMHYDEYLPSALDEDWTAVELPYKGGALSMVVIMPNDLASFETSLDVDVLDEIFGRIREEGIHLSFPRFTFSTHASLVEPLQAMGVTSAFGEGADFSRMTADADLFVQAAEHEAFIDVDEAGTKAAASSGVAMAGSHGPTIEVDRPFLFVIRHRATNAVLFMGRVADPSA